MAAARTAAGGVSIMSKATTQQGGFVRPPRGPQVAMNALKEAAQRILAGTPAPAVSPKFLRWQEIECIPDLFQHRKLFKEASDKHVQILARAIEVGPHGANQAAFTPILVYWVGDGWVCVDGHHKIGRAHV